MTSDLEKAAATRAVEALEDLPQIEQLEEGGRVYSLVFGLDPWGDASPSLFPAASTIRLWRGWDTHRELLRRVQAVRANAYNTVGRSAAGRPISTVAARTPLGVGDAALDYWSGAYQAGGGYSGTLAAASGFAEGFSEGADNLADLGRGFLDKIEKIGPFVAIGAAAIALLYVVTLVKR